MTKLGELDELDNVANLVDEFHRSLLSSLEQVALITSNGQNVKFKKLEVKYKYVGLYFSYILSNHPPLTCFLP